MQKRNRWFEHQINAIILASIVVAALAVTFGDRGPLLQFLTGDPFASDLVLDRVRVSTKHLLAVRPWRGLFIVSLLQGVLLLGPIRLVHTPLIPVAVNGTSVGLYELLVETVSSGPGSR